ncbi:Anti-sigma factor [Azospirillaceae bacterium]
MRDGDLHAYVDGQLDPARRIEVEAWLTEDVEAARRVQAYRDQAEALHALFDSVLIEQAPAEINALQSKLAARLPTNDNHIPWFQAHWLRAAAMVALVTAAGVGGWYGRDGMGGRSVATGSGSHLPVLVAFAEEAANAHNFYANSRFEVEMGADDQDALNGWLSERLGRPVFGPELTSAGFRLIGGRSLPTDTGVGVLYMYESDRGERLTLFVGAPQTGESAAVSYVQRNDIGLLYWAEGSLSYALAGRFKREQLTRFAQAVYQSLKDEPAKRRKSNDPASGGKAQPPAMPPSGTGVPRPSAPSEQIQPSSGDNKPKPS